MENFLRQKRKKNAILRSKELGLRRRLVKEWDLLTDEQKTVTRSLRGKKGIKCEKCGSIGYYIEICPNNCYEPPPKEEVVHFGLERFGSDDDEKNSPKEPQGEGFYWNFTNEDQNSEIDKSTKRSYYPSKADLSSLRNLTLIEKERLHESDSQLTDYEFHRRAQEGYSQNLSELSLHQALRYFMRILEREIQQNVKSLESKVDLTLFHPPAEILTSHFYPKEVGKIKEYRNYFHQHEMKKDRQIHSHQHYGALRPEESMSVYYRGNESLGHASNNTLALYEPNPQAGQSIHGKIGWKSILATNDDLAISDPKMMEKLSELTRLESQQSAWTSQQKRSFENQNERYQHMWHIIKQEILHEHDREKRLLSVDVHANQKETEIIIWKERIEAADRLIETLRGYGYLRGTNEADYIVQGIEKWKKELIKRRQQLRESGVVLKRDVLKKKKKKKSLSKSKSKRRGGSHLMSSLVRIRSREREEEEKNEQLADGDQTDTDQSEDDEDKEDDDDISLQSLRKIKTAAQTTQLLTSSITASSTSATSSSASPNRGGFYGLGLLSTVGATEIKAPVESSTSVATQLLMKGPMGLVSSSSSSSTALSSGNENVKSKSLTSLSTMKKSARDGAGGRGAGGGKGGNTIMARKKNEEMQMQLLATRYTEVGLQRNIRQGSSEDFSTFAPALIPFHEVLASRLPPEEIPKSYAGQQAIIEARKRDANPITGTLTPKYLPLYVRSTLFESNGTTPGGDQTYARMSHDRRYSHQLGRTMAALEPLPTNNKLKKSSTSLKKIEEEEEEGGKRKAGKIRLV